MTTFANEDTHRVSPTRTFAISVALVVHVSALLLLVAPARPPSLSLAEQPPAIEVLMPEPVRLIPPPPLAPVQPPTARPTPVRTAPPQPVVVPNPEPAMDLSEVVPEIVPPAADFAVGLPASDGIGDAFAPAQIGAASYWIAPLPKYPAPLIHRRVEGEVTLLVTIGVDGYPESVGLFRSSGAEALDRSALETVRRKWRFRPQIVDGLPARTQALVPIRFTLPR
jgi:periplasmic protein TonB